MTPKLTWQERIRDTEKLHKQLLRENPKHRVEDTAILLNRSLGSISEDLMLASWLKTHPTIQNCLTMKEAICLIRKKKAEMRVR